jgi:hypothetical protein
MPPAAPLRGGRIFQEPTRTPYPKPRPSRLTLTSAALPSPLSSRALDSAASVAASAAARLQSPIASHQPPLLTPPRPRDAGVTARPQRLGVRAAAAHCALWVATGWGRDMDLMRAP